MSAPVDFNASKGAVTVIHLDVRGCDIWVSRSVCCGGTPEDQLTLDLARWHSILTDSGIANIRAAAEWTLSRVSCEMP